MSRDDVHRLLQAERRRLALDVLSERGGSIELRDLAEAIVEREGERNPSTDTVHRVMVELYHCHLPLMADLGAIEFDRSSKRIEARLASVRTR